MVIDSSALVAILQREPERRGFIEAIEAADTRLVSVATFVEISIVIEAEREAENGGESGRWRLEQLPGGVTEDGRTPAQSVRTASHRQPRVDRGFDSRASQRRHRSRNGGLVIETGSGE